MPKSFWSACVLALVMFEGLAIAASGDDAAEIRASIHAKYDEMVYETAEGYPLCSAVLTRWMQEKLEIAQALENDQDVLVASGPVYEGLEHSGSSIERSLRLGDQHKVNRVNRVSYGGGVGVCFAGETTVVTLGLEVDTPGDWLTDATYKIAKRETPLKDIYSEFISRRRDRYQFVLSSTVDSTNDRRYQRDCWARFDAVSIGEVDGGEAFNVVHLRSKQHADELALKVTPKHRFLTISDQQRLAWKTADSLEVGNRVYSGAACRVDTDGHEVCQNTAAIEVDRDWKDVTSPNDGFDVYNLSVEKTSVYFVGTEANHVLVHNDY